MLRSTYNDSGDKAFEGKYFGYVPGVVGVGRKTILEVAATGWIKI